MKVANALLFITLATSCTANAQDPTGNAGKPTKKPATNHVESAGERAFVANCGRCHTAPEQLPPRITGTVLQHMRVRAPLSAADQKALLEFLAP